MLLKCCTQYVSKCGKLSSGHRTGKGQFSFQSQRKAMLKHVQTTIQLHSFHMLTRLSTESFKLGFNSMSAENFQMYKLYLEKAEEPEIKLPTSVGSQISFNIGKSKEFQKNIYSCFIEYAKAFDFVDHNKLWRILKEMGTPDHLICLLRNLYAGQEATVKSRHGTTDCFNLGKEYKMAAYCHSAYLSYMQCTL